MNMIRIFAFIFKFGACYGLWNYTSDPLIQMAGIFLFVGFSLSEVDELRKDSIIKNNK
tara:strand:+ start:846 stop:1019 length:174 start_codon:yes stop_codon:yes gene_type:complete